MSKNPSSNRVEKTSKGLSKVEGPECNILSLKMSEPPRTMDKSIGVGDKTTANLLYHVYLLSIVYSGNSKTSNSSVLGNVS